MFLLGRTVSFQKNIYLSLCKNKHCIDKTNKQKDLWKIVTKTRIWFLYEKWLMILSSDWSHRSLLAAEPVGVGGEDSQGRDEQRGRAASVKILPSDWRYEVSYPDCWSWQQLWAAPAWVYLSTGTPALLKNSCSAVGAPGLIDNSSSPGGNGTVLLTLRRALLVLQAESLQILFQNIFLGKGNLRPCKIFISSICFHSSLNTIGALTISLTVNKSIPSNKIKSSHMST